MIHSTLVSNELGAGKPEGARVAVYAVVVLAIAEFLVASTTLYLCRGILGYAFSGEKEVVDGVKAMVPLLCLSIIMDSTQAVLSGVARGSRWQHIGAYVNLGSYYIVGIPVALVLGFVLDLKGKGLWSGLVAGATVQSISLSLITSLTNWDKQVSISFFPFTFITITIYQYFVDVAHAKLTGKGGKRKSFFSQNSSGPLNHFWGDDSYSSLVMYCELLIGVEYYILVFHSRSLYSTELNVFFVLVIPFLYYKILHDRSLYHF